MPCASPSEHRSTADDLPPLPAAVLWDMDGTIVDTEEDWIEAEKELARSFGKEWSEADGLALVGQELTASARIIKDRTGIPLDIDAIVERLLDSVIESVTRDLPWRPGALELHDALRREGVPMALVTMSYARFARPVAAAMGPDAFDVIVAGDDVERGKPHPEPYEKAAALLGVDIARCVALEDSATGIASAVAAGARTIGVHNLVDIPRTAGLSRVASLRDVDVTALRGIAGGIVLDTLG